MNELVKANYEISRYHVRQILDSLELSIIRIDTKEKKILENFKRNSNALPTGRLEAFDYDFSIFSDGMIVPHGIHDVTKTWDM